MKKKVLYYAPMPSDSTSFWRCHGVLRFINSCDFELVDVSGVTDFNWVTLIGASIFIFQRPFTPEHAKLISLCKDMGMKIICDYDDNLFSVDMFNPTHQLYAHYRASLNDCIRMADELWVSTRGIADEYKHPNAHVIPNAHNDYLFPMDTKRTFKANKKVIYRGGGSHKADVFEKAEMLVSVINAHTDWTFQFMGDRYEYIEQRTGENHHIVGGMPIMSYFKYLYHENPSVMIFPLCDTAFNRSKSNISWLEASYVGAAFFGNTNLPEYIEGSILPIEDLDKFIDGDADILEFYNTASWQYICDNLLLSKVNELRTDRILANL